MTTKTLDSADSCSTVPSTEPLVPTEPAKPIYIRPQDGMAPLKCIHTYCPPKAQCMWTKMASSIGWKFRCHWKKTRSAAVGQKERKCKRKFEELRLCLHCFNIFCQPHALKHHHFDGNSSIKEDEALTMRIPSIEEFKKYTKEELVKEKFTIWCSVCHTNYIADDDQTLDWIKDAVYGKCRMKYKMMMDSSDDTKDYEDEVESYDGSEQLAEEIIKSEQSLSIQTSHSGMNMDIAKNDGEMMVDKDQYITFLSAKLKQMEALNLSYLESINDMQAKKDLVNQKYYDLFCKYAVLKEKQKDANVYDDFFEWTCDDVLAWMVTLDNGRFVKYKHLIIPMLHEYKVLGPTLVYLRDYRNISKIGINDLEDQLVLVQAIDALIKMKKLMQNNQKK